MNNKLIADIMQKMIDYSNGNLHDIAHFMKVYAYARTIGIAEGISDTEQETLEIAAILHDIACPLCREKYGNTSGKYQEQESSPLAESFLRCFNLSKKLSERVIYLISHHHTYTDVDGWDYQILLEADFLVNAHESDMSIETIQNAQLQIFKTEAGTTMLNDIFLRKDQNLKPV